MFLTPNGQTNNYIDFVMHALNPRATNAYKSFVSEAAARTNPSDAMVNNIRGSFTYNTNTSADGIRFYFSIGPIASGTIRMYGIKKS